MVELDANQKLVFDFLIEHLKSQEMFSEEQLHEITSWTQSSWKTYWTKIFRSLLKQVDDNKFLVKELFRRYSTEKNFLKYISQSRKVGIKYSEIKYENVMIFEFFMPLSNENYLRRLAETHFFTRT